MYAAQKKGCPLQITGCNVVSVAEHVVLQILALVRNFVPAYKQVIDGKWNIAEIAHRIISAWKTKLSELLELEGLVQRFSQRLGGFECRELCSSDFC